MNGTTTTAAAGDVIDFDAALDRLAEKKVRRWYDQLTPERRLKFVVIHEILGHDQATDALIALDLDVDRLFSITAQVAYESGATRW